MKKMDKSWMAVLPAALLLSTLAGVVWARPRSDGSRPAEITRKVALAGADLIPARDGDNWHTDGGYAWCESGTCMFTAPVVFPCLPSVTIECIKLHVNDWNDYDEAELRLNRVKLSKGAVSELGWVQSPWGTSGGFQTYASDPINKVVWPSQRAYIKLVMGTDMLVYGVTIEYHRNV